MEGVGVGIGECAVLAIALGIPNAIPPNERIPIPSAIPLRDAIL
jgi:hypothetical protein